MRSRILHTALTVFASAGLLAAGGAFADPTPVFAAPTQVWFSCDGQTTKLGNANDLAFAETSAGWDTTAPTASVTSGAGCGQADPAFLINTAEATQVADPSWSGTFTGNLNAVTVELHTADVGLNRALPGFAVSPRLFVDGSPVPLSAEDLDVVTEASATGLTNKVLFSLTDLGVVERDEETGEVLEGPSAVEHTVTLQVNGTYIDGSPVNGWVWDTTEVPAGIVFNPASAKGARLSGPGF